MRSFLIRLLHPKNKTGGYFLPDLVLLVLGIFLLGAVAGWWSRGAAENYYAAHYRANVPLPSLSIRVPVFTPPQALGLTGGIHWQFFTDGNRDQDGLGACVSWAFAKGLSYAVNWNKYVNASGAIWHHHLFYSPRWMYDLVTQGIDEGSWTGSYPPVVAQYGAARWSEMPYGSAAANVGLPAYADDWPVASRFYAAAAQHRVTSWSQNLFSNAGAGDGGVQMIEEQLASHHMVSIALPVYPEFDNATNTSGFIDLPQAGESPRGGHQVNAVGYTLTRFYNGTSCWIKIANQWGRYWGVDVSGNADPGNAGFGFLSCRFVGQYVFDAWVVHAGKQTPVARPPTQWRGTQTKGYAPPPSVSVTPPGAPRPAPSAETTWYVQGVHLYNNPAAPDISGLINAAGDRYHIWPLGIASMIGVESSFNPNAERWAAWPDQSCGLAQQILANVTNKTGLTGIAACRWEESPANSIDFGAQILRDDNAQHGGRVPFPYLYAMYNEGSGYSDAEYFHPSNSTTQQALSNFIGWMNYGLAHWAYAPRPAPQPVFHLKVWNEFRASSHQSLISPYYRGRLSWPASKWRFAQWLKGVKGQTHTYGQRRGMYQKTAFRHGAIFCWYATRRCAITRATAFRPTRAELLQTYQNRQIAAYVSLYPGAAERCHDVGKQCSAWMYDLINEVRAENGLPMFGMDWQQSWGIKNVCMGSYGHSRHMVQEGFISHDDFPADICRASGYKAENVGRVGPTTKVDATQTILALWMSEPHTPAYCAMYSNHACSLLSTRFSRIGIGIAGDAQGNYYATADFTG